MEQSIVFSIRGEGVRGKVPLKFGITGGDRKNLFEMGSKQEMGGLNLGWEYLFIILVMQLNVQCAVIYNFPSENTIHNVNESTM